MEEKIPSKHPNSKRVRLFCYDGKWLVQPRPEEGLKEGTLDLS